MKIYHKQAIALAVTFIEELEFFLTSLLFTTRKDTLFHCYNATSIFNVTRFKSFDKIHIFLRKWAGGGVENQSENSLRKSVHICWKV